MAENQCQRLPAWRADSSQARQLARSSVANHLLDSSELPPSNLQVRYSAPRWLPEACSVPQHLPASSRLRPCLDLRKLKQRMTMKTPMKKWIKVKRARQPTRIQTRSSSRRHSVRSFRRTRTLAHSIKKLANSKSLSRCSRPNPTSLPRPVTWGTEARRLSTSKRKGSPLSS